MEKLIYPHQLVIEEYKLQGRTLGKENDEKIEQINSIIEKEDATPEELEMALKESKLIAGILIARFAKMDKSDIRNYRKEQKKKEEVSDAIKEATKEIQDKIEDLKQEEQEKIEEPEVEEVDAPDGKNSKIQAIIDFFESNSEATEKDLIELGLKNIQGAEEIILIPEKFKIVKKGDKYFLKKKSNGIFGWILFGLGALVAGFLGYNYYKNKE